MTGQVLNVYCDESCHLLNDHVPVMTLGALALPEVAARTVSKDIRAIKNRFGCLGELKWSKVSPKNLPFYISLVDYFFDSESLCFRSLVVQNKDRLDHERFNKGDHDSFYYKMYYYLIRNIVENRRGLSVRIYLDLKDTRSSQKVRFLSDVLANTFYDFTHDRVQRVQQVRSHESEPMQLCDFILGAVTYANRNLSGSVAKAQIVRALEQRAGVSLLSSTAPWEIKFNLFHFAPRET